MTRRTQNLLLIALSLLLLSFHVRLKQQADPYEIQQMARNASIPKLWEGKVAPDFTLTRTDSKPFVLADEIGKRVIILNFFATWCQPCRAETPELNRFVNVSKDKPVILIGIDAGEKPEVVAKYVSDLKVAYPVAIDDGTVAKLYGVSSYPTTVVIGPDGRVSMYETGAIANADVGFGVEVAAGLDAIARGSTVTRDQYLSASRNETYYEVRQTEPTSTSSEIKLTGRAALLAEKMNCVCGCSDTLKDCKCSTADGMKKKLAASNLDGTNDVAVMEQINAEFCMKGM